MALFVYDRNIDDEILDGVYSTCEFDTVVGQLRLENGVSAPDVYQDIDLQVVAGV